MGISWRLSPISSDLIIDVPRHRTLWVRTDTFPPCRTSSTGSNPDQSAPSCSAPAWFLEVPSLRPQPPGTGVPGVHNFCRAILTPPELCLHLHHPFLSHYPVCSSCSQCQAVSFYFETWVWASLLPTSQYLPRIWMSKRQGHAHYAALCPLASLFVVERSHCHYQIFIKCTMFYVKVSKKATQLLTELKASSVKRTSTNSPFLNLHQQLLLKVFLP